MGRLIRSKPMAKMRANGRDIIASKTENRTMMGTSNRANKSHIGEVRRTKNLRKVFMFGILRLVIGLFS
jgi:hypothetical protein